MCIPYNRFTKMISNRDKISPPRSILNFLSKTTDTFLIVCNERNNVLEIIGKLL